MGNFFSRGPAAPTIQQVTFQQTQTRITPQDRIKNRNEELIKLIKSEYLPTIVSVDKLSIICQYWMRKSSVNQKLNEDAIKIIIKHIEFDILEYKLINKIIENGEIKSSVQWFFDQTNMKLDQILIAEILASKRRYINCEYMTKYLETPDINEITRINYLKLCGITESLGGIEACFRYFFSNCCLYIASSKVFDYQLLFAAFSKTMLLNNNIKDKTHRMVFENDSSFIPYVIHFMFWSTAKSSHYRNLSTNPSNPIQTTLTERHGVIADILQIFEENGLLQMEHGLDEIEMPDMVQITP